MSKSRVLLSLATALTCGACVADALDGLDGTRDASVALDAGACIPGLEPRTLSVEDTGWPGWNGLVVDAGKLLMRVASGPREPRVIYRDLATSSERIEAEGVDAFVLGGREGTFVLAGARIATRSGRGDTSTLRRRSSRRWETTTSVRT
ncbi:MAG: hypothetical protein RMA76_07415 [Deltaproteobacteria bacterium]|jgi:hypothetical protein